MQLWFNKLRNSSESKNDNKNSFQAKCICIPLATECDYKHVSSTEEKHNAKANTHTKVIILKRLSIEVVSHLLHEHLSLRNQLECIYIAFVNPHEQVVNCVLSYYDAH